MTGHTQSEFLGQVNQHRGILFKIVNLYARDAEAQKDLQQEIMLQAWKSWPNFRGDAKFSTWLYRICLNTALTYRKKEGIIHYREEIPEYSNSTHTGSEQQETIQRLYAAMRRLHETDRAIISLHLDGYDNGEIGEMIGITVNHVAVKLHRIKQQLSTLLKND